tara:strand:- start:161 stop:1162 length:1002 start_codon:yes stop_codon:yes gene_type:complete
MSNKFNELLDLLVNEENDKAEELFHDIVVEKSRDIYNELVEQDVEDVKIEEEKKDDEDKEESKKDKMKKEGEESDDEAVEETEASDDDAVEETEASEEDAVEETADEADETIEEVGGDATDDLIADINAEQNGDEMAPEAMHSMNAGDEDPTDNDDAEGSEEAVKDKVMDLENALDELKAEFDAMMGDDDKGDDEEADAPEMPEMPGEEVEMEADATEEEAVEETADEEVEEGESKTAEQLINEYSDMVKADMSNGEESSKSPVAAKGGTEPSANASDLMDTKEAGAVKSADKPKDMGVDAKNKPGIKKAKMDNAPKPTTADTPDNKTSVTPK